MSKISGGSSIKLSEEKRLSRILAITISGITIGWENRFSVIRVKIFSVEIPPTLAKKVATQRITITVIMLEKRNLSVRDDFEGREYVAFTFLSGSVILSLFTLHFVEANGMAWTNRAVFLSSL
ncbi:hypothetical protein [Desulfurobacterium crinifex]